MLSPNVSASLILIDLVTRYNTSEILNSQDHIQLIVELFT